MTLIQVRGNAVKNVDSKYDNVMEVIIFIGSDKIIEFFAQNESIPTMISSLKQGFLSTEMYATSGT